MALAWLLQAVLCIALLLVVDLVDAQNPQLELVYFGRSLDNRITLECRQSNSLPVPSPQFWVGQSDLRRVPGSPQNGRIIFGITQDLEGTYSCNDSNTGAFSDTLDLVGKGLSVAICNCGVDFLFFFHSLS